MVKNLKEKELVKKSKFLRLEFIKLLYKGFKFHIGGTLSCIDILIALFYSGFINLDKKNRNLFILSKGHALAALYLILLDKKKLSFKQLKKKFKDLRFGGQLDIYNSKFVDWNTGSLGHSVGVAIGLAKKEPKKKSI
jgi:transketolase